MATKVNEAPEAAENATEGKATKKAAAKEYKLRSANKFLTVGSLNVQFFKGIYTTKDPAEAKALLTIEGVELVEE